MGVKVKNHIVTRGYLSNWKSIDSNGKSGLWYFDMSDKAVKFSPSLKAPFAIVKGIYSPKYVGGQRDDRLENWFSESESELCDFVRNYRTGKPRQWKAKAIQRALAGIVSLGYRSEHSVASLEDHYRNLFPGKSSDEIRLLALNNLYNIAHNQIAFFSRGTAVIVEDHNILLSTNDQPFWDMTPQNEAVPTAFFPISPTRTMFFAPGIQPRAGDMQIAFKRGPDFEFITKFAHLAAMRMARNWVVCPGKREAEQVKSYLTDEVIAETRSTDRIRRIEVSDLRHLFSL